MSVPKAKQTRERLIRLFTPYILVLALYGLRLLDLWRQGARRRRLSLTEPADEQPLRKKLAWFVLLWAGGIVAAVAVGYGVKRAMVTAMTKQF